MYQMPECVLDWMRCQSLKDPEAETGAELEACLRKGASLLQLSMTVGEDDVLLHPVQSTVHHQ
eukprot:1973878-Amphidinium_carterae.1